MTPLERTIEDACLRRANKNGWMSRKMNGMGFNSWPDRLFIAPNGDHIYVEFKRPGQKPTTKQLALHKRMTQQGCTVLVVDNTQDFYWWVLRKNGRYAE